MDGSPRLIAALEYALQGLKIFPCKPGTKEPCFKEPFNNASTDPAIIRGWFERWGDVNLAFCPEDNGLFVIDLDNKNGKQGQANWEALPFDKPRTRSILTPTGGLHLHYKGSCRMTTGFIDEKGKLHGLADGIDTRGIRSLALLPPSLTKDGIYDWLNEMEPAWGPPEIIEWGKPIERVGRPAPEGFVEDQPWNIGLARGDLEEMVRTGRVAIEGNAGNALTFLIAAEIMERGLTVEAAAMVMGEVWNPHCSPPWDDEELEQLVINAREYMTNDVGCRSMPDPRADIPEGVVQNPPAPPPAHVKEGRRRFQGYSPAEHAKLPPIEFWDDHRPKPIMPKMSGGCAIVVYGAQGSHKTGVMLKELVDLALHKGARILYVAAEGALGIGTARMPALMRERGRSLNDLDGLWITCPDTPDVLNPNDVNLLLAEYKEFAPNFIVFDTGTRCIGMADINSTAIGTAAIVAMEKVGQPSDATVLYITHPGKDEERGAIGSKQQENQGFGVFRVENDGAGTVTLTVEKMKDGQAHFSIPFRVTTEGVPVVVEMSPEEQARAIRMTNPRHDDLRDAVYREVYGWLSGGAEVATDNRGTATGPGYFAARLREKGWKLEGDKGDKLEKSVAVALEGLMVEGKLERNGKSYKLSPRAVPPDSLQ